MTAHADHYRRLAAAALDITDPAAQADAALCCVRDLLDAADYLGRAAARNRKLRRAARVWRARYVRAAAELADAKERVIGVLNAWFPTALAGTPAPREPVTAYRAAYADVRDGRLQS